MSRQRMAVENKNDVCVFQYCSKMGFLWKWRAFQQSVQGVLHCTDVGIMNGMEYFTVPLLLNKIRARSVLIIIWVSALRREVLDWNISSDSIILHNNKPDYSLPTNAFCHFLEPFCSALNQLFPPGFVRYSVAVIVEQRKLKFWKCNPNKNRTQGKRLQ